MSASPAPTVPLRQDAETIGLIGLAHGTSHFFHMLLPPLFPMFIRDFGFSYAELGLLVSTFFVISGVGQATSGFVVDKFGARPVLFLALACFAAAGVATATANGYPGLMLAAALAGLGNSPFHPIDFTILNKRVSQPRLGHAFSVHGITGNLGWAGAPVFLTGMTALTGSWRVAAGCTTLWVLFVIGLLWLRRASIDDRLGSAAGKAAAGPSVGVAAEHPLAFLRLPSIWLCFSFFFFSTCAMSAVQSFASPSMQTIYGLPLATTAIVVTGFMLFSAAGMVVGGFLTAKVQRLEKTIAAALAAAAALLALVGTGWLPGAVALVVAAFAGFGVGLAGPSRDMLIKRASPPGATGRVYGTVYSGLDLGFAVSAPMFGALLDHGQPGSIFYGAGFALLLGVASAGLVGLHVARGSVTRRAMA